VPDVGGIVFNLGNILIVAAIAIAGLAVAFPVGVGLALVVGSVLNYIITPKGNPWMLFGGISLVCLAIALDALAYRRQAKDQTVSVKGLVVSVLGGVVMGLFYRFVVKAIKGENHFGPYTVAFFFALVLSPRDHERPVTSKQEAETASVTLSVTKALLTVTANPAW
jgi:glucose uptake protein